MADPANKRTATKINRLIGEIQRDPFTGIGKPQPLKGDLSGYWSRRIDDEHRLVSRADDKQVGGTVSAAPRSRKRRPSR